jgi:beta-mannanase
MKPKHLYFVLTVLICLIGAEFALANAPETHPGIYTGVYLDNTQTLASFEQWVGKKMAITMWFTNWNRGTTDMPGNLIKANAKFGKLSMVTWEPFVDLDSIIQGTYDDYLHRNAKMIAALKIPVMIRFGHEMNGNWYAWDGFHNGGGTLDGFGDPNLPDGPERYVAAFRHIVDIFRKEGAHNALWVWCVNEESFPTVEWNDMMNYYPGDSYVDWLAVDGYNWGTTRPYGGWRDFMAIMGPAYDKLTTAIADKPVMIGEFASAEEGGDKAAWIKDSFEQMKKLPRLKAFVWFNVYKETAWSLVSSDESLEAFQNAMKDKAYVERFPGI